MTRGTTSQLLLALHLTDDLQDDGCFFIKKDRSYQHLLDVRGCVLVLFFIGTMHKLSIHISYCWC